MERSLQDRIFEKSDGFLTREKLLAYHNGELSTSEMYEVEKYLIDNDFDFDALDGFESDADLEANLDVVDSRIDSLIGSSSEGGVVRKLNWNWKAYAAAASILLLLGTSTVVVINMQKSNESLVSDNMEPMSEQEGGTKLESDDHTPMEETVAATLEDRSGEAPAIDTIGFDNDASDRWEDADSKSDKIAGAKGLANNLTAQSQLQPGQRAAVIVEQPDVATNDRYRTTIDQLASLEEENMADEDEEADEYKGIVATEYVGNEIISKNAKEEPPSPTYYDNGVLDNEISQGWATNAYKVEDQPNDKSPVFQLSRADSVDMTGVGGNTNDPNATFGAGTYTQPTSTSSSTRTAGTEQELTLAYEGRNKKSDMAKDERRENRKRAQLAQESAANVGYGETLAEKGEAVERESEEQSKAGKEQRLEVEADLLSKKVEEKKTLQKIEEPVSKPVLVLPSKESTETIAHAKQKANDDMRVEMETTAEEPVDDATVKSPEPMTGKKSPFINVRGVDYLIVDYSEEYEPPADKDRYDEIKGGVDARFYSADEKEKAKEAEQQKQIEITYEDYLKRAMVDWANKNHPQAEKKFNHILKIYPGDQNAYHYGGLNHMEQGKYTEAIEYFDNVLASEKTTFHQEAKWFKALCLQSQNNTQASKQLFQEIMNDDSFYRQRAKKALESIK